MYRIWEVDFCDHVNLIANSLVPCFVSNFIFQPIGAGPGQSEWQLHGVQHQTHSTGALQSSQWFHCLWENMMFHCTSSKAYHFSTIQGFNHVLYTTWCSVNQLKSIAVVNFQTTWMEKKKSYVNKTTKRNHQPVVVYCLNPSVSDDFFWFHASTNSASDSEAKGWKLSEGLLGS